MFKFGGPAGRRAQKARVCNLWPPRSIFQLLQRREAFLVRERVWIGYRCPSHLGTNAHFALLLPDAFGLVDHGTA